jgi:predicted nucleic acid-binding protein
LGVYLDTSVLAGLFVETDVFAERAANFFMQVQDVLIVSDFATAEFASVLSRVTRMKAISAVAASAIFNGFDHWRARFTEEEDATASDIRAAIAIIRRFDLNLRAPDAINLAITMRLNAAIATFDQRMAQNARALGIAVAPA